MKHNLGFEHDDDFGIGPRECDDPICDAQSDCLAECEANYVINNAIINLIITLSYCRVCHQQLQLQRRLHAR